MKVSVAAGPRNLLDIARELNGLARRTIANENEREREVDEKGWFDARVQV